MAEDQAYGEKLIWFVAGAAIGAAVALLYAPASGSDTREYLGKKTREGRDALAESSKEMYERGRELYDRGRKMADDAAELLERGRNIVEKAAENASETVSDALS
ncbi:MAG: YtxH domain-containing protein [Acidobacteria bacterium]|nr:YtxH domain-containing protein [Acidobacteriota bacterium]